MPLPLFPGSVIVIADSGIRRSLAHSAYNQRRAACEQAVMLLRQVLPDIQSLRDLTPPVFAAYNYLLPDDVRPRAEHVVREIARVESAVSALRRADVRSFGGLMFAGHASLRDLFEVSLPELDALVEIARGLPGCIGARLTGAGFGGCTVNLVEEQHVDGFVSALSDAYWEKCYRNASVYACRASQGADSAWL
jgi:galactokinase